MHIQSFAVAAVLSLSAFASATAGLAAPGANLAAMDCAALGREMAAVQKEQLALFATPMTDPQALGRAMNRIGQRGADIQTQREAKKCAGATIDKNDLGK